MTAAISVIILFLDNGILDIVCAEIRELRNYGISGRLSNSHDETNMWPLWFFRLVISSAVGRIYVSLQQLLERINKQNIAMVRDIIYLGITPFSKTPSFSYTWRGENEENDFAHLEGPAPPDVCCSPSVFFCT